MFQEELWGKLIFAARKNNQRDFWLLINNATTHRLPQVCSSKGEPEWVKHLEQLYGENSLSSSSEPLDEDKTANPQE